MRIKAFAPYLMILPLLIFFILFFITPILYILRESFNASRGLSGTVETFTLENYGRVLIDAFYQRVTLNTLLIGFVVTVLDLIIGYPLAYHLAKSGEKLKQVLVLILMVPMFTSLVIRGYMWRMILSDNGVLNNVLLALGIISSPIKLMFTTTAVIIGMVHVLIPFMVLPIWGSIENIPPSIRQAAYNLGAGPLRTFLKITLPLSMPGLITGCLLVFAITVNSFVTPAMLGGPSFMMLGTIVYQQVMAIFDWPLASALCMVMLIITVTIMFLNERMLERYSRARERAWQR
jgi:ABC-type spermidine/putrescine transport system permease subunit I